MNWFSALTLMPGISGALQLGNLSGYLSAPEIPVELRFDAWILDPRPLTFSEFLASPVAFGAAQSYAS